MDIPEIRILVGHHLGSPLLKSTRQALASLVRVCKDWHETFIPLLYNDIDTVDFSADVPGVKKLLCLTVGLQRHGQHITKLSVKLPYPFLDTFATSTGNIKEFSIVSGEDHEDEDESMQIDKHGLRNLFNSNPGIERLSISRFYRPDDSRCIAQIIQFCPQLRYLEVDQSLFDLVDMVYLHGFSRLSEICFQESTIRATGGPLIRVPSLPSLRYLRFMEVQDHAMPVAMEMISRWHHLERVNFGCYDAADPFQEVTLISSQTRDVLQKFQLSPQLSVLSLSDVELTDQDLARVLDGCPSLRELELYNVHTGEASFSSLLNLAGSLTKLGLDSEKDRRYWTPRRILCSFPKLVNFSCSRLDVDEMFFDRSGDEVCCSSSKSGPDQARVHLLGQWKCKGLLYFRTDELILSFDKDRNQGLIDQFGTLQRNMGFTPFQVYHRAVITEASDFHPSLLARRKPPKMRGAITLSLANIQLGENGQMQYPDIQFVLAP